jgi:hypothetical protein
MPLLNGCATTDPQAQKTEKQRVPASLLTPCAKSDLDGTKIKDAIRLAEARGKDVDECNRRLEDIRAWSAR